jgi:hypothetical protein
MIDVGIAALFERVRAETARMLNLDLLDLNPAQVVRLDHATALRLELDRLLAIQMRGEPIDIGRLTIASTQLETMLRDRAENGWNLLLLSDDELVTLERLCAKASRQFLEIEPSHSSTSDVAATLAVTNVNGEDNAS